MIAPFATLAFLAVMWISAFAFAEMFGRSGRRVLAALRGETPAAPAVTVTVMTRTKRPTTASRPLRAQPQLRAAA